MKNVTLWFQKMASWLSIYLLRVIFFKTNSANWGNLKFLRSRILLKRRLQLLRRIIKPVPHGGLEISRTNHYLLPEKFFDTLYSGSVGGISGEIDDGTILLER